MKHFRQIRSVLRGILLSSLGYFSRPESGIHILNGHKLTINEFPNGQELDNFRNLLIHLQSVGVKFINFQEAVRLIEERREVSECLVAFTWDDGFQEQKLAAQVLSEFGVNCCLFINPNYVEGDSNYIKGFDRVTASPKKYPLRWTDIIELQSQGHIIGAHTMDHYMIGNSGNKEELRYQIVACKNEIEKRTGRECKYFAWPFGRLSHADEVSVKLAAETYTYVFSQSNYKKYFSFNKRVINRRHFEPFWPVSHVQYFLSCKKD